MKCRAVYLAPLWALFLTAFLVHAGTLNVSFSTISTGSVVNLTTNGALDWVHWGLFTETSIDRKGGAPQRISNFTAVSPSNGFTFVYQYADNWNGYTWGDGDPHMNVTNTPTGVWAYAANGARKVLTGSGFRFTAAASTNEQILRVYVGAFGARGKFTASLSDTSAPPYSSSTPANSVINPSNGPSAVYTLAFAADSTNQFLTVTYVMETVLPLHEFDGNVTLQAAALTASNANNLPFITLTSPVEGTSVTAPTNLTLSATASDVDGFISRVEFYAGTDKLGEATIAPYSITWSNPPPGIYAITARAIDDLGGMGVSRVANVFVAGTGGFVTGSRAVSPLSLNLTTEGTSDWAHWGLFNASSFNHKASGGEQIANFTRIGTNTVTRYADNRTAFSWNDGTPVGAIASTNTGVFINGLTNGFELSAPADTNARTLRVYVGLYGAQGNLQAWLTDFSGQAFTDTTLSNVFNSSSATYTLNYAAATMGQRLIVRYTAQNLFDFAFGNVTLQAATLQGAAPPVPIRLLNPGRTNSAFRFSFASLANQNYAAQFTPSLNPISWQTFTNVTGSGGILSITNEVGPDTQRFYRVLAQ